jgi:macrodomain Ter protein organizer (MatP/YcbG family)
VKGIKHKNTKLVGLILDKTISAKKKKIHNAQREKIIATKGYNDNEYTTVSNLSKYSHVLYKHILANNRLYV